MKTPEQVAEQILTSERYLEMTVDDLGYSAEDMIVEAIKADRAQRADAEESARASLADYWKKSERDTFEAIDGMEWAEELANILEGLVTE